MVTSLPVTGSTTVSTLVTRVAFENFPGNWVCVGSACWKGANIKPIPGSIGSDFIFGGLNTPVFVIGSLAPSKLIDVTLLAPAPVPPAHWKSVMLKFSAEFSTLPKSSTLLLYCVWSGPTSCKSLGILFILSLSKIACAVLFNSPPGNNTWFIPLSNCA